MGFRFFFFRNSKSIQIDIGGTTNLFRKTIFNLFFIRFVHVLLRCYEKIIFIYLLVPRSSFFIILVYYSFYSCLAFSFSSMIADSICFSTISRCIRYQFCVLYLLLLLSLFFQHHDICSIIN